MITKVVCEKRVCERCGKVLYVAYFTDTYDVASKTSKMLYLCNACQSGLIDVIKKYVDSGKVAE